jgi:hypothetical protein
VKIGEYESHPAADVFPMLEGAELRALVADIAEHGLREPIWRAWVDGGAGNGTKRPLILDGRNRLRACYEACIKPEFREYDGDDPIAFVVSLNMKRRHLSESQRAIAAAELANLEKGQKSAAHKKAAGVSQERAAKLLNVSRSSVQSAKKMIAKGTPELIAAAKSGAVKVKAAAAIADMPAKKQREIVERGPAEARKRAAESRPAPARRADMKLRPREDDAEWDEIAVVNAVHVAIRNAIESWPSTTKKHRLEHCLLGWLQQLKETA